jgi:hypothetical protein
LHHECAAHIATELKLEREPRVPGGRLELGRMLRKANQLLLGEGTSGVKTRKILVGRAVGGRDARRERTEGLSS